MRRCEELQKYEVNEQEDRIPISNRMQRQYRINGNAIMQLAASESPPLRSEREPSLDKELLPFLLYFCPNRQVRVSCMLTAINIAVLLDLVKHAGCQEITLNGCLF